jgi:hypothetical protein
LLNRIKALVAVLLALLPAVAFAKQPTVADLDAASRAGGNRKELAMHLGGTLFKSQWPVQIFRVSADSIGTHIVLGLGLYGVKFHHPITQAEFAAEVAALVKQSFEAVPDAEEVDVWTVVPINVGKGVIVSGDLAKPTTRTVFSLTVTRKGAPALSAPSLFARSNAYWDEEWAHTAFKKAG